MDGVLYLGRQEIPGAAETLRVLKEHDKRIAVVTNNSGQTAEAITKRLEKLGFPAEAIEVVIATNATAAWMAETRPNGTAFVLGAKGLVQEIECAGITVCTDPSTVHYQCDFLVVGNDGNINYDRLTQAIRVGRTGALYIAVNQDHLYPARDGLRPGAGALVSAIANGIGRDPDVRIGKPSPLLLTEAMRRTNMRPEQSIMIGDTLDIDIQMGQNAGTATALVLTGVDDHASLKKSNIKPTYVLESVADLPNSFLPNP